MDKRILYNISYGLFVLTTCDNGKDNGCIINTVLQVTDTLPYICVIAVNKQNYTHEMIANSKVFNLSVLTTETTFDVFKNFGFQSGRNTDKFSNYKNMQRSENGIIYLPECSNSFLSFKAVDTFDFNSHSMFKAELTGGEILTRSESLTYSYYQQHIKQNPETAKKSGYVCNICGYIHENEPLPPDFICPICKHGSSYFSKI